jgi:SAM-dependent methyltransferase
MLQELEVNKHSAAAKGVRCPACDGGELETFFEIAQVPVLCNILCASVAEAQAVPRGDMNLGFCRACGHVYNASFDPQLLGYNATYENSLQFSPTFREYLESLAAQLVERYGLHNKNIIEIGCGQGDFLSLLCRLGGNRGLGFDPSFDASKAETALADGMEIVAEHFSQQHADRPVDLLCSRHVLEHIPQPLEFLKQLRQTIGNRRNVLLFFEVPNALFTLDRLAIWDLIYEHCSYFSPASLRSVFEAAGFEVLEVDEVYDRQFLTLVARPASGDAVDASHAPRSLHDPIRRFGEGYRAKAAHWGRIRDDLKATGRKAVIWGAGSKGATFVNVLEMTRDFMPYAADLSPRKHGHFMVGTAQQIVRPEFLAEYRPDLVIAMNPIYSDEIAQMLRSLGPNSQLLVP